MLIIETKIKVDAINKFDQGGIYIRFDQEHWLKTGLEYVDGEFKLSCVVTNEFSDWSTQSWSSGELRLRVFRQKHSYVVEYHDGSDWVFFRITHINSGTLEGQVSYAALLLDVSFLLINFFSSLEYIVQLQLKVMGGLPLTT